MYSEGITIRQMNTVPMFDVCATENGAKGPAIDIFIIVKAFPSIHLVPLCVIAKT